MMLLTYAQEERSDQEFMLWLYESYHRLMFATAKKYIADNAACEDIIQDSLLNLIKKVPVLRTYERCILPSYIVSTVRNTAINYLKRKGVKEKHIVTYDEDLVETVAGDALPLDVLMELAERRDALVAVWPELPEEDRLLLEGKYILGQTDAELAGLLGCKADSVRMKLTRARRNALKKMVEKGHFYEQA